MLTQIYGAIWRHWATMSQPFLGRAHKLGQYCAWWYPGGWINIKTISYQYRKSHCGDKTILRPSYLHNGISYTGKMSSLYWIRALALCTIIPLAHIDGLVQERHNSSALAMELRLSWTTLSTWYMYWQCKISKLLSSISLNFNKRKCLWNSHQQKKLFCSHFHVLINIPRTPKTP